MVLEVQRGKKYFLMWMRVSVLTICSSWYNMLIGYSKLVITEYILLIFIDEGSRAPWPPQQPGMVLYQGFIES